MGIGARRAGKGKQRGTELGCRVLIHPNLIPDHPQPSSMRAVTLATIIFCASAIFSAGTSMARSPRATMMPSVSAMMESMLRRPSSFSICCGPAWQRGPGAGAGARRLRAATWQKGRECSSRHEVSMDAERIRGGQGALRVQRRQGVAPSGSGGVPPWR